MQLHNPLRGNGSFDVALFLAILFLVSLGLLMIYSTGLSSTQSLLSGNFFKQLIFVLLGLSLYALTLRLGYRWVESLSVPLFVVINLLVALTIFLGFESHGAVRWIDLGFFSFQPTEFAKPVLILFLASFFDKNDIKKPLTVLLATLCVTPLLILTFLQPDLGNTVILILIVLSVYFLAGLPIRYFVLLAASALIVAPVFWGVLHDYQRQRLLTFISPEADPTGTGYNSIQALIAVGSGRVLGQGFGRGTQGHLDFLPEKHTDFIFANLAEELGFVGVVILLTAFCLLFYRLCVTADKLPDPKMKIYTLSVALFIAYQVFINIGMNVGLLPVTGITLPLVSYGGSSLLSVLFAVGLVQSAQHYLTRHPRA